MPRNQSNFLSDLIEIASKLPWKTGIVLAVITYVGFHYLATLPPASFVATDMKTYGQTVGSGLVRQLAITFGMFLQYLVPGAFLIGAGISFYKRNRQSKLHAAVAQNPSRNTLECMSWREFEGLAAEVFRRKGFRVTERGGNGPDGGVDIELHAGADKYLVQCKQWKVMKVGVAPVRELYGVMAAEGAVGGFVVASGEFTEEAKRFAEGRSIELVSTDTVLRLIQETKGTGAPVSSPAENPSCPKCGNSMVQRTAKRGDNAGGTFWGCSQYPACRGIRSS